MVTDRYNLTEQACKILQTNDRGGFTVPTARLYPYQWNWDSAFVALGFASFDNNRAWRELETLFEGQWENGMIPSILFRRHDPDYFPGADRWGTTERAIPSAGVSQPPVAASVALKLVQSGAEDELERAAGLLDGFMRSHRWFYEERKHAETGVIGTVHPWETGRDNCPDWELGLGGMEVDPELPPYTRMDTKHANPAQRPTDLQYDKYLTIVKFGRDHGWDQQYLTNNGPFLMADPCIHFILLRANKDLLKLAKLCNRPELLPEIETWIEHGTTTSEAFWNQEIGAYTAKNLKTGEFSTGFTNASALCFYAGVGSKEQHQGTLANIKRIQNKVKYLIPSWDPDSKLFEPKRYWCGPIWPQMNLIIAQGLSEHGHTTLADQLRQDLMTMIEQSGFYECFDPMTGEGCIGENFSWTAAVWLHWTSQSSCNTI